MTEKIEKISSNQRATTKTTQHIEEQNTKKLLSPSKAGALSVLSYPPLCSFHSSYLDLRDLGQWFLGQLGQ